MSQWPSVKAKKAFKALLKLGWVVVSQSGSHIKLKHKESAYPQYVWSFGDGDELGSKILSRIAKHTGLNPEDFDKLANTWNSHGRLISTPIWSMRISL